MSTVQCPMVQSHIIRYHHISMQFIAFCLASSKGRKDFAYSTSKGDKFSNDSSSDIDGACMHFPVVKHGVRIVKWNLLQADQRKGTKWEEDGKDTQRYL